MLESSGSIHIRLNIQFHSLEPHDSEQQKYYEGSALEMRKSSVMSIVIERGSGGPVITVPVCHADINSKTLCSCSVGN